MYTEINPYRYVKKEYIKDGTNQKLNVTINCIGYLVTFFQNYQNCENEDELMENVIIDLETTLANLRDKEYKKKLERR